MYTKVWAPACSALRSNAGRSPVSDHPGAGWHRLIGVSLAFVLACLGFLVLTRARRAETTIAFIAIYGAMLFARAMWLDDPLSIPLHQVQNGALLIFAFFDSFAAASNNG